MIFIKTGPSDVERGSHLQFVFTYTSLLFAIEISWYVVRKMPNRCVAGGCSNLPDPSQSIGLHKFPDDNDLDKKRRRLWVAFVRTKCAKWSPTANSRLCSEHFKSEYFESPFTTVPGTPFVSRALLKKDAVPTIHKTPLETSDCGKSQVDSADSISTRGHRRVSTN